MSQLSNIIGRSRPVRQSGLLAAFFVLLLCAAVAGANAESPKNKPPGSAGRSGQGAPAGGKPAQAEGKPAQAEGKPALGKDAFNSIDQKAPLLIKSKTLELNSKERTFTYKDDVEVQKGDLIITAEMVIGSYNEKNEIQKVVCQNNVVVTRGDSLRASSNRAVYYVDREIIEMTEAPDLIHAGSALSADKITFYVAEDRSEAEGNVRVKVIGAEDQLKSGK